VHIYLKFKKTDQKEDDDDDDAFLSHCCVGRQMFPDAATSSEKETCILSSSP